MRRQVFDLVVRRPLIPSPLFVCMPFFKVNLDLYVVSKMVFIIISLRNGSHQIPRWGISKIHTHMFKLEVLSNSLSLILGSINATSLSKRQYTPILFACYMPGTELIIDNTKRNRAWLNVSHVVRNLTF